MDFNSLDATTLQKNIQQDCQEAGSEPLNDLQLVYPADLLEQGIGGDVLLSCNVDEQGKTSACKVLSSSGQKEFEESALHYVQTARYRPRMCHGIAVKEYGHTYKIGFALEQGN